jgi:prolyl-tRNA synthetase
VIARASQLFLPTLREPPADAEAVSHQLLVRGGFIRQVGAGLFSFLPLGWRVHQKVVQIIREEMDAIGGQEMLCPVLTPAELWKTSGRYDLPVVFKLRDGGGREFVLPMSHEETFTFHAKEIQSYKQLPQILYHFSTKERDEPRPRGGLLRVREFIMKDAYSFDRDREGLDRSFELHEGAYRRIFERCELETYEVVAESGVMGGRESWDFLAPGPGSNELVRCENGDYAADREAARGVPRRPDFPPPLDKPEEIETPGVETIEQLADLLGLDTAATAKAMPIVTTDGTLVLALVRGDDRLNEEKLMSHLGMGFRPATDDEIRAKFGAGGGSLGPVGVQVEVVADDQLREGQYVTGANRDGFHLRGVEAGRDFAAEFADIRELADGDRCPECGGALIREAAMELGHVFKLETHYSERFEATYLDEHGHEQLLVMGSYGIGPARTMAAIVEQHHDEHGIAWPASVAPYDAHVVVLPGVEVHGAETAMALDESGLDVLVDDRDQRAGEKFADADLIGCPIRVTVGKRTEEDGAVDVRERASGEEVRVPISELAGKVAATR